MNINVKSILFVILILLIFDLPMKFYVNYDLYTDNYSKINVINKPYTENKKRNLSKIKNIIALLIYYAILATSIYYLNILNYQNDNLNVSIKGLILGFIISASYNTHTLYNIDKYEIKTAIIDTIWNTFLIGITSVIGLYLYNNYINIDIINDITDITI